MKLKINLYLLILKKNYLNNMNKKQTIRAITYKINRFLTTHQVKSKFINSLYSQRNIQIKEFITQLFNDNKLSSLILFAFDWDKHSTFPHKRLGNEIINWGRINALYQVYYDDEIQPLIDDIDEHK